MNSVRVTGIVILTVGFAASAIAVVPSFDGLLHGSKPYLLLTFAIGLAALIGGVLMPTIGSGAALTGLMAAMGVLWLVATVHHVQLAHMPGAPSGGPSPRGQYPPTGSPMVTLASLGPLRLAVAARAADMV